VIPRQLTEWLHKSIGLSPQIQDKLLLSIIIILVIWFLHRVFLRIALPRIKELSSRYRWKKTSSYIAAFLGILIIGRVWFEGTQSLVTFLGLLSAGVAIALKDLVASLVGWGFILWRQPFEVGDRVQIGNYKGDVIDIRIFQFTLMEIGNWVEADQSTGRIIHIPNGKIFTEPLANYHKGFQYIWNEIPVLITFESNWKKAKEILQRIGTEHAEHLSRSAEERIMQASRKFMIFYSALTPSVYTSVKDSGVLLTIRYLCEPRRRRDSQQAIWETILREFAQCSDIDLAYPTQRFFDNLQEGKAGKKPRSEDQDKEEAKNK
jgi:small-conductance mechanosensitive channel